MLCEDSWGDDDEGHVCIVLERDGLEDTLVRVAATATVGQLRAAAAKELDWGGGSPPENALDVVLPGEDAAASGQEVLYDYEAHVYKGMLRVRVGLQRGFAAERWLVEHRAPPDLWGVAFETAAAPDQAFPDDTTHARDSDGRDWATIAAVLLAIQRIYHSPWTMACHAIGVNSAIESVLRSVIAVGDVTALSRMERLGLPPAVHVDALCYAMHVYIAATGTGLENAPAVNVSSADALRAVDVLSGALTAGDVEAVLAIALWRGELLKRVLVSGLPVGGMALLQAAAAGRVDSVRLLLEHFKQGEGGGCTLSDDHPETPLGVACQYGHADVVDVLVEAEPTQVNRRTARLLSREPGAPVPCADETPLGLAAGNAPNGAAICERLLTAGAEVNPSQVAQPPLHAALRFGSGATVALLLRHGASVASEGCLLALASGTAARRVRRGITFGVAASVIQACADEEAVTEDVFGAAVAAAVGGRDAALMQLLLDHGANPMWRGDATALFLGCMAGADTCVEWLLPRVAPLPADRDSAPASCLCLPWRRRRWQNAHRRGSDAAAARVAAFEAAAAEEEDVVEEEVLHVPASCPPWRQHARHGRFAPSDVQRQRQERTQDLRNRPHGTQHLLAEYDTVAAPAARKSAGGAVSHINVAHHPSGLTALHVACYTGAFATARRLVMHGADVNAVAADGRTALMLLVIGSGGRGRDALLSPDATPDRWELLMLLLRRDANVSARTGEGLTAMDYAYLCVENRLCVCRELKRACRRQEMRQNATLADRLCCGGEYGDDVYDADEGHRDVLRH